MSSSVRERILLPIEMARREDGAFVSVNKRSNEHGECITMDSLRQ
jgi:hypothetical protein